MGGPDILRVLRREVDVAQTRVRNGIAYARGDYDRNLSPTPKDLVWQRDKVTLWRVRSDKVIHRPPVLAMIGLVSRPYVLDLLPGNTFLGALSDAGFDVYLLDWGVPDEADAGNTLETYANRYLPRVLRAVRAHSASETVNLLAYCMGAQLALLYLSQRADPGVSSVVTLAPPVDFTRMGALATPLADDSLDPDLLIGQHGLVPGNVIGRAFAIKKPTYDVTKYVDLIQKLTDDQALDTHAAVTRWVRDHIPLPGATFRQMTQMFYRDNGFITGTARLGNAPARLSDITVPVLNVIAQRDDVIPIEASTALAHLVPADRYEELQLRAGHIGLVLGRTAAQVTIPAVIEWFTRHSEPQE